MRAQDFSDRVEQLGEEDPIVRHLESEAAAVVGRNWDRRVHEGLLAEAGTSTHRRYNYSSVRDCVRLVRNKRNHFAELPTGAREEVGGAPEGLIPYMLHHNRFPRLLMAAYDTARTFLAEEDAFRRYFRGQKAKVKAKRPPAAAVPPRAAKAPAPAAPPAAAAPPRPVRSRSWMPRESVWLAGAAASATAALERVNSVVPIAPPPGGVTDLGRGTLIVGVTHTDNTRFMGGANAWDARYKTQECSDWRANAGGHCRRGVRCDFMHGPVEARLSSRSESRPRPRQPRPASPPVS